MTNPAFPTPEKTIKVRPLSTKNHANDEKSHGRFKGNQLGHTW